MTGAVYALILNALVALLFAVAFAVIRISYSGQRRVMWFCAAFLIGMLTPLSELGVRFTPYESVFVATSYASLLLSLVTMALGLAAVARRPIPWRAAGAIVVGGAVIRAAVWNGQRGDLVYELAYQASFAAAATLGMYVSSRVVRSGGGRLWLCMAVAFGFLAVYFLVKPFFASTFGPGATASAYASSRYALFSQATAAALIVTIGLLKLLIAVEGAMGQSMRESQSDPLTGIANRRGFEKQAARAFAEARRSGQPLSIVIFDLDRFKLVNDTYGHSTGDAVIRAFGQILRSSAPPAAVIARLGGEEFVMLLVATTLQGAWQFAQTVRIATIAVGDQLPAVTVSGGIAELQPGETLEILMQRGDYWAYAAKNGGRNRIYPELSASSAPLRIVASNP